MSFAAVMAVLVAASPWQEDSPLEARLHELVEDLDDEEAGVRLRAEAEIELMGVHALPHLERLAEFPSLEVESAVRRVIEKLRGLPVSPLFGPAILVSLDHPGGTLREGLGRLAASSGLRFELEGFLPPEGRLPALPLQACPLFRALDEIGRRAGATYRFAAPRVEFPADEERLAIRVAPGGRDLPTAYCGPCRISLERVRSARTLEGPRSDGSLTATIQILWQPNVLVSRLEHKFEEARVSDWAAPFGEDPPWVEVRRFQENVDPTGGDPAFGYGRGGAWVRLDLRPQGAGEVLHLRGRFRVSVPGARASGTIPVRERAEIRIGGLAGRVDPPDIVRPVWTLFVLSVPAELFAAPSERPLVIHRDETGGAARVISGAWSEPVIRRGVWISAFEAPGAFARLAPGTPLLIVIPEGSVSLEVPYEFERIPLRGR